MKCTDRRVILIEGSKVAHGATGHNAGQIVADFEREFTDLVREYGLEKAADAEKAVRGAWVLLEELYQEASLSTPMSSFMGYNGYCSIEHLIQEIKANILRKEAGLQTYSIYIASEVAENNPLLKEFKNFYETVPVENILSLLETGDTCYVAAVAVKKGCMNSAMLTEELTGYLLATHKERFSLYEHSSVRTVDLNKDDVALSVTTNLKNGTPEQSYKISANKIILCTNGFERIHLKNNVGDDIDVKFHQMVSGDIGYMAAYVEDMKDPPTALGYYDQEDCDNVYGTPSFFYLTKRPYELEKNEIHNLVCVGGPEKIIPETENYDRQEAFSVDMGDKIDRFVKKTIKNRKEENLQYKFQWHGVMCYTPSRMRIIGPEPKNQALLYNLGCNGVGILASIYGGWKISKLLLGEQFPESIFDPKME